MRKLLTAVALAAPLVLPFGAQAATNLLVNGSFEAGFAGWTLDPAGLTTPATTITYGSATPYPTGASGEAIPPSNTTDNPSPDAVGAKAAYFVSDFANPEALTQSVTLAAGWYEIGFDAYLPNNGFANAGDALFLASVGGAEFASFLVSAGPAGVWQHFSALAEVTDADTYDFSFNFFAGFSPSKDVVVDRVYVISSIPEPETYALMLGGLGLVGWMARRRKSL